MMDVTFLAHSGVLVETETVYLLFDWWLGTLPPMAEKPLLVFASHRHEDHFKPDIFALDDGRKIRFLLGKDIKLTPHHLERWGISDKTAGKCLRMGGGETAEPLPGITVETLSSTDDGVAFLVRADEKMIFHAGDLNWWHWEGEPGNEEMEQNFKAFSKPLRHRTLDLAMLPLDPRLGEAGFWGPKFFMELAEIRHFLPIHQWKNFSYTRNFLTAFPAFAAQTIPVAKNGQRFSLD